MQKGLYSSIKNNGWNLLPHPDQMIRIDKDVELEEPEREEWQKQTQSERIYGR